MSYKIPYSKQSISTEDEQAVIEVLRSDFLTQGPAIAEFENNFAKYIGCKYAVAVSNGTAALHLPFLAMGLGKGDGVITTPITFSASANAALYCNATVHFADIDRDTYVLSLDSIKELLSKHPKGYFKAIVPVDFAGFPANLEAIRDLANEYGIFILEDACHAPGGYFRDSKGVMQKCGNGVYADAAAFSFHSVKHIATGEGGMITTNNEELYNKLMVLRTHGITKDQHNLKYDFPEPEKQGLWYYEMQMLGYNYRITDIQAALGTSQLKRAHTALDYRQNLANRYREAFLDKKIKMQKQATDGLNAFHLFIIEVEDRKGLYDYLRENGIFAQIHYVPVHLMPYYRQFGWQEGDFPNAEDYYRHCISLPLYPTLSYEEQDYVITKVIEFCGN